MFWLYLIEFKVSKMGIIVSMDPYCLYIPGSPPYFLFDYFSMEILKAKMSNIWVILMSDN